MEHRLRDLLKVLLSGKNDADVYAELALLMKNCGLFHEQAGCLEKLWHKTQKHELYIDIGNIFANKLNNREVAKNAYNQYLKLANPKFYILYAKNLTELGFEGFEAELDNEDYTRKIVDLTDKYNTVVYMMIYLHKERKYQQVIEFSEALFKLKRKINNYFKNNPERDNDYAVEIKNTDNHISQVLSETYHHNDINRLAIKLNPDNERAYVNIIHDLITYKNYDDAVEYYNKVYAKKFNNEKEKNIIDICWKISDYFRDRYEFYNAVAMQQAALELEPVIEEA